MPSPKEQKAMATLALITERAGVQVGDLTRTQDSAANKARQLAARLRNFRDEAAQALLPILERILDSLLKNVGAIGTFTNFLKENAPVIEAWAVFAAQAFKTVGEVLLIPIKLAFELGRQIGRVGLALHALATGDMPTFHQISREIEAAWKDLPDVFKGAEFSIVRLNRLFNEPMNTFAQSVLTVYAPSMDTITNTTDVATQAVDRLADALSRLNAATSLLGGLARIPGLGLLSSVAGPLGIAGGVLGPAKTLFDSFSGAKAFGGHIPSGTVGLVGERGPELVQGPADVTPLSTGGSPMTLQFTFVTPDGRMLADIVENHMADGRDRRRVRRVIPLGA